jgi:hypothetical protein
VLAAILSAWAILGGVMKAFSAIKFVSRTGSMLSKITGIGSLKAILALVLVLGIGGSVYGFWKQYNGLVQDNAALSASAAQMEIAVQVQDATIEAQREALTKWEEVQAEVQARLQEIADGQANARAERERLIEVFSDHDLAKLLDARPELILRRINDGTASAFRMLECASGGSGGPGCTGPSDTSAEITVAPETGTD